VEPDLTLITLSLSLLALVGALVALLIAIRPRARGGAKVLRMGDAIRLSEAVESPPSDPGSTSGRDL
jgi:hypothetical protein